MHKNKTRKNQTKYYVKIKSTVHPNVHHTVLVDLHCYERMPEEKNTQHESEKNHKK